MADFVPVVGDIKGFAEAEDTLDFLAAAIGVIPVVGDVAGNALKAAKHALKKGDVAGASKWVEEASQLETLVAKQRLYGKFVILPCLRQHTNTDYCPVTIRHPVLK
ncbi:hypothetical protein [Serratia microhaemolytica]|uniref:hypothetical protein n=1 Tax=Serratia microhaemolytica TaxID=2675110 RepID=UPI000FDF0FC2|nr:hypothetical protein [Serratia microhaemolytica]